MRAAAAAAAIAAAFSLYTRARPPILAENFSPKMKNLGRKSLKNKDKAVRFISESVDTNMCLVGQYVSCEQRFPGLAAHRTAPLFNNSARPERQA
jgi:hypothetical protein